MALHPRVYGQQRLDLMGFKNMKTQIWVGEEMRSRLREVWEGNEHDRNALYEIFTK